MYVTTITSGPNHAFFKDLEEKRDVVRKMALREDHGVHGGRKRQEVWLSGQVVRPSCCVDGQQLVVRVEALVPFVRGDCGQLDLLG